jgi:cytidyltransferase-like protein
MPKIIMKNIPTFEDFVFEATLNGKRVCIFPGRFQPFHNGHIEALKRTSAEFGCPVVPLQIFSKNEKSPFDVILLAKIGHKVAAEFSFIEEFWIYPPGNKTVIPQMVKFLQEKGLNPIGIGCGSDRQKDYERQVAYLTSEKSDVRVDEFSVAMVDSRVEGGPSGTKVREAIIADDEATFNQLTPKSVHPFYKELRKKLT